MARRPLGAASKIFIAALLLAVIVVLQYDYDNSIARASAPAPLSSYTSPEFIRLVDMGFHSTIASTLWASTMPEILDLFRDRTEYLSDLHYLVSVDPKFGYPYAF